MTQQDGNTTRRSSRQKRGGTGSRTRTTGAQQRTRTNTRSKTGSQSRTESTETQKTPRRGRASGKAGVKGKRRKYPRRRRRKRATGPISKSVGAVVLNERNQVLLVFQTKNQYWEFPKGKVEKGEKELDTLRREMFEETGIKRYRLVSNFRKVMSYEFQHKGKVIRRQVIYFLMRTRDRVRISDEHSDHMWLTFKEAKEYLKHANQARLLDQVRARLES